MNCPNCQTPLKPIGDNFFCLDCDYDDLPSLKRRSSIFLDCPDYDTIREMVSVPEVSLGAEPVATVQSDTSIDVELATPIFEALAELINNFHERHPNHDAPWCHGWITLQHKSRCVLDD